MNRELTFEKVGSKSGNTDQLVIFLHGYGANGADLLNISQSFKNYFPNMVFLAPNAPFQCEGMIGGYKWFNLPWLDNSKEYDYIKTFEESLHILDEWLTQKILYENVEDKNVFLFGFSQGTMLALHAATIRKKSLGGVLGFSGKLIEEKKFNSNLLSKCPILLVHGDQDDVVPYNNSISASEKLKSEGFQVNFHLTKGIGHGISPEGLQHALNFLNQINQ